MHVAITGGTGMIGSALSGRLRADGHRVTVVSRQERGAGSITWSPAEGRLDPRALSGVDAVVHLAAEPIRPVPSTAAVRERIAGSRKRGTGLMATAMAQADNGPRVLVSVSGTNYYGDRGDEELTEDSPPGDGFLSRVCREWEVAADPARAAGIRVVHPRIGIVQSRAAMAVKVQLPLYRLGLGGRLGSGRQFWSWITLTDVVGILTHVMFDERAEGPVNATAPHPVRQGEYARTLARVLQRPALLPVPAFAPRLVLGKVAEELALSSMRVVPRRLTELGYTFRHPTLEEGLRAMVEGRIDR